MYDFVSGTLLWVKCDIWNKIVFGGKTKTIVFQAPCVLLISYNMLNVESTYLFITELGV